MAEYSWYIWNDFAGNAKLGIIMNITMIWMQAFYLAINILQAVSLDWFRNPFSRRDHD